MRFILTASAEARFENVQIGGVDMRLAEGSELADIELRFPNGRAWLEKGGFGVTSREPTCSRRVRMPAEGPGNRQA